MAWRFSNPSAALGDISLRQLSERSGPMYYPIAFDQRQVRREIVTR